MAISQSKYINIISAVGGAAAVGQRDLIGRVFSTNPLIPTGQVIEFTGGATNALASISDYFGSTSAEYTFASKYFQSTKTGTAPQKLSFARYANEALPATLYGLRNASTLEQLKALTAATLNITINGEEKQYTDINLSSADNFAAVATTLDGKVNTDGVNVEYDAPNARFVIKTTATGEEQTLSYATGTVAEALGWTSVDGVLSDGVAQTSAVDTVSDSAALSNNFFTLYFLGYDLSTADITAVAQWVHAQNVRYMYSITVNATNSAEVQEAVKTFSGTAITVDKFAADAGFMPMSRIAAVNYNQANAAISLDYQQFAGVEPSVITDADAAKYDALRINYYGATQQAGQTVAWYQPGILQGDIADMGVYANEAWLKDSFFTNLLNLRLGLNSLPANNTGIALILGVLMETVNLALFNGVVLPGKTLDATQKAFITQLTSDKDAWQKVQSSGYYLTADLVKYNDNGVDKYKASFLFVYSKGDSINYIDGRDILI